MDRDFVMLNKMLRRYEGTDAVVHVPDGVEKIGRTAFRECYGVEEVFLPSSVKEIAARAFGGCRNLRRVHIPEQTLIFGEAIFQWCRGQGSLEELAMFSRAVNEFTGQEDPLPPKESPFEDWVLTVYTPEGSGADLYAREYGIPVVHI